MVAFSDSKVKMIPPPPTDASKKAVRQHIVDHIYAMPEFMRCATHIGLHVQGGPSGAGQLDKARVEARAIVARLPPIERFNVQWVLRLANATAAKAWEVLSVKGPRKRMVPVPVPTPAPARSVSDAHKPRLAASPYDPAKRGPGGWFEVRLIRAAARTHARTYDNPMI